MRSGLPRGHQNSVVAAAGPVAAGCRIHIRLEAHRAVGKSAADQEVEGHEEVVAGCILEVDTAAGLVVDALVESLFDFARMRFGLGEATLVDTCRGCSRLEAVVLAFVHIDLVLLVVALDRKSHFVVHQKTGELTGGVLTVVAVKLGLGTGQRNWFEGTGLRATKNCRRPIGIWVVCLSMEM